MIKSCMKIKTLILRWFFVWTLTQITAGFLRSIKMSTFSSLFWAKGASWSIRMLPKSWSDKLSQWLLVMKGKIIWNLCLKVKENTEGKNKLKKCWLKLPKNYPNVWYQPESSFPRVLINSQTYFQKKSNLMRLSRFQNNPDKLYVNLSIPLTKFCRSQPTKSLLYFESPKKKSKRLFKSFKSLKKKKSF